MDTRARQIPPLTSYSNTTGAHKVNQKALESTFVMSNVVPQDPSNNGSDWLRLELWTRQLAKEYGDVIVVNAVG